MKRTEILHPAVIIAAALLLSCGEKQPGTGGLDTTVVGEWIGVMGAIPLANFNGAKISARLEKKPPAFELVTRDTTRGTTAAIRDTTLVLTGAWAMNSLQDSVLLTCDTGRIVDTALNILKPLSVRGQVIPVYSKTIAIDGPTGAVYWDIAFTDFLPLAPLLGITIPAYIDPSVWKAVRIILQKTGQ